MAACPTKKASIASICVVVVVVCVALAVIGVTVFFILHRRRRHREPSSTLENPPSGHYNNKKVGSERDIDDESNRSSRSMSSNHSRRNDHMKLSFIRDDRERFDLQELLRASAEILGSGFYSSSYKASLTNGPTIVVKRFKQMNNVGKEEFQEHMRRIGRLNHPNLIPLVAYYYRKEEKLLVTDFVQNGSLAVRLHGTSYICMNPFLIFLKTESINGNLVQIMAKILSQILLNSQPNFRLLRSIFSGNRVVNTKKKRAYRGLLSPGHRPSLDHTHLLSVT